MKLYIKILIIFLISVSCMEAHNTIFGTVKDSLGKAVAGATIRLDNTLFGAIADKNGEFRIKRVPPGIFTLRVTAVGFEPYITEIDLSHKEDYIEELSIKLHETSVMSKSVVVSAARADKIYEDIPVKVSVIDNKIFEATQNAGIKEGIRFSPGLRVEANCQNCGYSQIRLNGLEGRYSQILIDGRPIFTSLNSLYGLDQIPSNMIDRVEVIRGGGSALYGSNAIAGIVNIITKSPEENNFEGKYNHGFIAGRIPEISYQVNGSSITEQLDAGFYVFGNHSSRDWYDVNGDGFSELPFLESSAFGARAFYNPNSKSKISFDYQSLTEYRRGGDNILLPPHEALMAEDLTHNINTGGFNYETFFNNDLSKISFYSSFNVTSRKNYTGIGKDPNGYGSTNSQVYIAGSQFANTFDYLLFGSAVVTSGIEYQHEEVENEAVGYRTTFNQLVNLIGFYIQSDWLLTDEIDLLVGIRADKHNLVNKVILNPRLTLMYKNSSDLSIRASLASGYRAPQAFDEDLHAELRSGKRMIIELSDDLKEERSIGFTLSADKSFAVDNMPFSFSAEYFYNRLSDVFINEEVGNDDKGNILFIKRNGDGAVVSGFTTELKTSFSDYYQLQLGVTYQQGFYDKPVIWSEGDSETGKPQQSSDRILRNPEVYGYLTAFINPVEHLEISMSVIYTGMMYVPHYAGGMRADGSLILNDEMIQSPDFIEFNSTATYIFADKPELALTFGIANILNQYQNDYDIGPNRDSNYIYGPMKPRTFTLGLSAKL